MGVAIVHSTVDGAMWPGLGLTRQLSRYCTVISRMGLNTSPEGPFNWVGGQRCDPVDTTHQFDNVSPRTGTVFCKIPASGKLEVDRAVATARAAFPGWAELSGLERGRILTRAAAIMRENLEDIARLGAWNYPMQTCTWKVGPALACGNTFVYKPSPLAPLAAVVLGEVLQQAGVPDGVYNVVQGEGDTGALLSSHPGCDKLSFTGSVPTGSKIMAAGAKGIKNVTLELGGKSPLLIFDDAHLKNAVKGALMANFLTQGEVCSNGTRIFVQRGIYEDFLK